ncbi:MAG: FMN reductase [Ignavibacteria bacterium GWF2_33_9]|nr:MAG: FMN reductase [Ignavibacteria bacterium GWF2_33_9]
MFKIAIISSSIREERKSHRLALYFQKYLENNNLAETELLDLKQYNFPIFEERFKNLKSPSDEVIDFTTKLKNADGAIIVTPEYNGTYPAALKNAIDLFTSEITRKPVVIATVSDGDFGGTQALISLQFTLWKMGFWTVPTRFHSPRIHEHFDENGVPNDAPATDKKTKRFINELLWSIEAKSRMEG